MDIHPDRSLTEGIWILLVNRELWTWGGISFAEMGLKGRMCAEKY